jgi:hypothetical protein
MTQRRHESGSGDTPASGIALFVVETKTDIVVVVGRLLGCRG